MTPLCMLVAALPIVITSELSGSDLDAGSSDDVLLLSNVIPLSKELALPKTSKHKGWHISQFIESKVCLGH